MSEGIKIVCENRKARHNYSIEETYEAGMVLLGTEVKALRDAKANLQDAYAVIKQGEVFLLNAHISPYTHGNQQNHEPLRTRKLLLKADEIQKLWKKSEIRGYNLVPLKLYFKNGICKCELALGKGKKAFDKRESIKEKDVKRSMDRLKRATR